jgi:hypothetical protein
VSSRSTAGDLSSKSRSVTIRDTGLDQSLRCGASRLMWSAAHFLRRMHSPRALVAPFGCGNVAAQSHSRRLAESDLKPITRVANTALQPPSGAGVIGECGAQ